MISKVKNLTLKGQTTKNELLCVLREESRKFSLEDIVHCSLKIQQEAECIHTSYKKEYIKAETGFLIRIREVKGDNFHYTGQLDVEELNTAIGILEEQEKMVEDTKEMEPAIYQIFSIISLYTTFIKD